MNEILQFLLAHCSFLYETNRFKFVDSLVAEESFGNALLVLSSSILKLRFVRDRSQLFLDFQSVQQKGEMHWHSIHTVRQLITGEKQRSAELNEDYAAFLREHLDEIERRFSKDRLKETLVALGELERIRAKELPR